MKKCFRCGFETLENANFCSNCGVALKDPMPEIVYLTDEKKQKNEIVAEENLETEISEIPEQLPNDEIIGENGEKSLEIIQNSLEIFPIIWQYILVDVPLRVLHPDAKEESLEGDGWRLITEDDKKEVIDPRLAKLKDYIKE